MKEFWEDFKTAINELAEETVLLLFPSLEED